MVVFCICTRCRSVSGTRYETDNRKYDAREKKAVKPKSTNVEMFTARWPQHNDGWSFTLAEMASHSRTSDHSMLAIIAVSIDISVADFAV